MSPGALLHHFDDIQHALFIPAVALALVLWVVALLSFVTGSRSWKPFSKLPAAFPLAIGSFAVIILAMLATGFGIEWLALYTIRPILFSTAIGITVDGRPIAAPQLLIRDLRTLPNGSDHHSHPTRAFRVVLRTERGALTFVLQRDSGDPTEYWVYAPDFHSGYLGKIHTSELDGL